MLHDVGSPAAAAANLSKAHGGRVGHVYQTALKGFSISELPPAAVAALRSNPMVAYVEADGYSYPADVQVLSSDFGDWGLDRMDSRARAFDGKRVFYKTGAGVHVYIIDSGIRGDHQEFAGRLGDGACFLNGSFFFGPNPFCNPYDDQLAHGTPVASAAAGATVGEAPGATVHSLRIDDENPGALASDQVAAIDWLAQNRVTPAVANLSYGDPPNEFSIRDAIDGAIRAGVTFVKSAGNENVDASLDRANRSLNEIVVAATESNDYRASYSNYGANVTLFAAGSGLRLAWNSGPAGYQPVVSGTSFAAPYAAGVAAAFLQSEPGATPARVFDVLVRSATAGVVGDPGPGSPNRLLYSLFASAAITGPTDIISSTTRTYTWGADVTGGNFAYTYQWEASVNGGAYTVVSTAPSYTRSIPARASMTLNLRLTVTTAGEVRVATRVVNVEPGNTTCPGTQRTC